MPKPNKCLIMAGGTGGHIYPALALAKALKKQGIHVEWLGTRYGMEKSIVQREGIPLHFIWMRPLRHTSLWRRAAAPFFLFFGLMQAIKIIFLLKPDFVVGMGGYVAAPGGIASWLLRVPLIIHEQNAVAGKTNRYLARFAKIVLQAFPNSFPKSIVAQQTGNPLREELYHVQKTEKAAQEPLHLLVLGGSQGAEKINTVVVEAYEAMKEKDQVVIWHQAGARHFAKVKQGYEKHSNILQDHKKTVTVQPFIDDMASAYAWADVVIARAGAITVAELAATGTPALLIPYPHAVDNHQYKNAQWLVSHGAAVTIIDQDFTKETCLQQWQAWLSNRSILSHMRHAALQQADKKATEQIVNACLAAGDHV